MGDYIKINRSILDWEWYKDEHTKNLFFHCMLKANWKEGLFKGIEIKRGQFATSIPKLELELELTSNEVRTAIKHLKITGEITVRNHSKFSVVTVVKYNEYQVDNSQINRQEHSQTTGKSQSINSLLTTIEEGKKGSKEEEKNKEIKKVPKGTKESRFAPPTLDEVNKYCSERNNKINAEQFVDFYSSKGWMIGKNKMKDWKAAVRTWENKEKENRVDGRTGTNLKPNAKSLTELAIEAGIGDTPFEGF